MDGNVELHDRSLTKGFGDSFGVSPDGFPQIITSKSLKNTGGGYSHYLRTIREVKLDAVNAALFELSTPEPEAVIEKEDLKAKLKRLRKLSED
ncbi:hypothetical protein N9C56_12180 [Paracoccaceae bacterium]|nr:hypothetical protein [Paracoccaceae bacterium]